MPPTISAVIPCRNEADHIEACLRSVLAQEPPPGGFEVLVVDGRSEDGTREIIERLQAEFPNLRLVDNPQRITPAAMNAGIRAAAGKFIAIMGAHNRYAPDYLCQGVAVSERTGADNVGGAMYCEGTNPWQRAIAAAHHSPFAVGGARWHNPDYEGPADTVFGGIYRREVFDRIGLFDESLVRNQDDELNLRLSRQGGRIWQSPAIRSWYRPRSTVGALFRQYLQYGYWKVRVIQKHRLPASPRHLVPAAFVLGLLLLPLPALAWPPAGWLWVAAVGAYLVANLSAAGLTAAREGKGLWWRLPPVFAAYHFGYGLGFLRGIWDFWIRRKAPGTAFTNLTRKSA